MHVLVTADTIGGVWTYTKELVCGLLCRGHEVTLVSFGKIPTAEQSSWIHHKRLSYYPTDFPLEWMQNSENGILKSARYLERIVHERNPDILHLSQYCYGGLECGIPKVVVAHSDVVSWWNAVHEADPPASAWLDWYRALVSRGLRCADAVVAPSRWMLDALYHHYQEGYPGFVIYNGRSAGIFHPSDRKTDCVLSVGRVWDEAKQIRLLLMRRQFVPVKIAGAADHPEKRSSSFSCSSSENLKFCGEQDEANLCQLYSDSATYAATSRYEPFGLAPVEAALSRCALVANDIPVFRELWGDAAYYFERNSPDGLAKAICALSRDESMRRYFADQAYECARIRFNSQRMVNEYEGLYRTLLPGKARA